MVILVLVLMLIMLNYYSRSAWLTRMVISRTSFLPSSWVILPRVENKWWTLYSVEARPVGKEKFELFAPILLDTSPKLNGHLLYCHGPSLVVVIVVIALTLITFCSVRTPYTTPFLPLGWCLIVWEWKGEHYSQWKPGLLERRSLNFLHLISRTLLLIWTCIILSRL